MTECPIVVTGGTGQLGYDLARALIPLGRVVTPTRAELDLASAASIRAFIRENQPRLIVNAAAYTAVDCAESEHEVCTLINAVAPGVIAEGMASIGGALIHFSTDYVFDGANDDPYSEADTPAPLNIYGETKLEGERAIARAGAAHIILRTSWLYSMHGRNFVRSILRLSREREELRVVSDQIGAPTWTRTLAGQTAAIVERLDPDERGLAGAMMAASGVYHLTSAGSASWYEVAETVLRHDPRRGEQRTQRIVPIATADYPSAARRPLNSRLDNAKIVETFGLGRSCWRDDIAAALREA